MTASASSKSKLNRVVAGAVGAGVLALAGYFAPSLHGVNTIQEHEGLRLAVYLDSANVPTICTGSTRGVYIGMPNATQAECDARLRADLAVSTKAVQRLTLVPISQGQFDALVSFVFNVGQGAYANSTMLKRINAGQCQAAAAQFGRWVNAGGRKLKGLVTRRAAEAAMFEKDCYLWSTS